MSFVGSSLFAFAAVAHLPYVGGIDGQSFKASDEDAERIWNDPNCDRTQGTEDGIDWYEVRASLFESNFPMNMPLINTVMEQLERPGGMDREAQVCPYGIIAVLFFFVKFLIERDSPLLGPAKIYFSLLDDYSSTMHPSLIDRADWLVKDRRVSSVRSNLLKKLRNEDTQPQPQPLRPRIFVYDDEVADIKLLTQGASFCGKGQWGMEVHIHDWLFSSAHRTRDPAEADFFFVPGYSICMFEGGFIKMPDLDELYKKIVHELPYFGASGGRDHIFTFGSGMSANVFRSWREEILESIFLTPETWLFNDFPGIKEPCFNTWKDIAIPGYLHRSEIVSLVAASRPLAEREHLAVFLGRTDPSRGPHPTSGGAEFDVRGALAKLHDEGKIFVAQNLSFHDMHATMGKARFCLVPKGKSAWSLRFYEALFAGCVPVVLSDNWELPFEDFLDLPSFVIKWPMSQTGDEMLETLRQQPDEVVERYMENGRRLRCWYVYPTVLHEVHLSRDGKDALESICPDMAENAFTGILRILERKRRVSRTMGRFFGPL